MTWHDMTWHVRVYYGMVWYGMAWYGMAWLGMVWYSMAGLTAVRMIKRFPNNILEVTTSDHQQKEIFFPSFSKKYFNFVGRAYKEPWSKAESPPQKLIKSPCSRLYNIGMK